MPEDQSSSTTRADSPKPTTATRLEDARLYLCTDARTTQGDLADFAAAAYAGGVDIIQIRDKQIEAAAELEALAVVAEAARRAGRLVAANDRADIAVLAGTDILHVGQDDLTPAQVRRVSPGAAIGLSTHDVDQMTAAEANPDVDYFCVGPLWATPTKPGRPAVGLGLVEAAAATGTDKPWFAIGGIDASTIDEVVSAGASRVVVVRAITEAADPQRAARRLRDRLP